MRTPKYCLHTISGQARVTINGRAYYLGQYGSAESWRKYHAKIAEWLASGCSKTFGIIVPGITILGLVGAYRPFAIQYFGTGNQLEGEEHRLLGRDVTLTVRFKRRRGIRLNSL